MTFKENFERLLPESIYIDLNHQAALPNLLQKNLWIHPSDKIVSVEKPGDGNMNFVLRVKTHLTSLIIKQSRPWVEKYPQIAAPVNRIVVEAKFYQALSCNNFFLSYCPQLIGFDGENFILALEDLGEGKDCTFLYKKKSSLAVAELKKLASFISHLHNSLQPDLETFPENDELKELNHNHIFCYPYQEDTGLDLDNIQLGLQSLSLPYKRNNTLKERLKQLGEIYLAKGNHLIHGDYYPGSWLRTTSGIKIIDPEFSHVGHAEFDLGIMMAHLKMAQIETTSLEKLLGYYQNPKGFNDHLFFGFCGVEIIRRIIGLAQLPLDLTLAEKSMLLQDALQLILDPEKHNIF